MASLSLGSVNPYKGLRAFREADAAEFQGRTALVDALVERVDRDPFVLVVGPSGSGKSSLVHAGAVPALRRRDALVVSMVPSADPFVELEAALRRVATTEVGDIGARLLQPDGLAGIAADITTGDSPLVLVIDQFEELWTLVTSDAVRDRFAASIAATLASGHDIRIIATLRADLYDRPLQHPVFGPIVRDATFAVTPMTSTELHDAITLPAERAGVRFEPGLVATMVGDVVARPGALPLLQFALTELFEQRINGVVTTDAYNELGGIGGAIARRAEQLYTDTPAGDRGDVRLLFTQLVTPRRRGRRSCRRPPARPPPRARRPRPGLRPSAAARRTGSVPVICADWRGRPGPPRGPAWTSDRGRSRGRSARPGAILGGGLTVARPPAAKRAGSRRGWPTPGPPTPGSCARSVIVPAAPGRSLAAGPAGRTRSPARSTRPARAGTRRLADRWQRGWPALAQELANSRRWPCEPPWMSRRL